MKKLVVVTAALLAVLPLVAQDRGHMDELIKHWQTSKDFTLAVAAAMPAADYGFKPNVEEMSFGEVMDQVARANASYISRAAGTKPPLATSGNFDKDTVMKRLNESFDYCIKTIDGLTPGQMNKMAGPEGRQMSGRELIWAAFTHTAHHRGQAEVYLRVKGIKPPEYTF
ncbi:MAG: DinB family protein [Pseudomonadota bacterium]